MQYFGFPAANDKLEFELWFNLMVSGYPLDRLRERYEPPTDPVAKSYWLRLWSDMWFRCASRVIARTAADVGVSAYLYDFDVAPGAHTQELDYVFGWPGGKLEKLFPGIAPSPPPQTLVAVVQAYWTSYARTGEPYADGAPQWPAYTRETAPQLRLSVPVSAGTGLSAADCDLWDSIWGI